MMNGRLNGISAFPETFFVDKNGNIVGETYSGSHSLDEWKEIVEKELENVTEGKSMNKLKTSKMWNSKWPALILMLVGVCFMGYGISRGELAVVFTKAINICMECVGIG